MATSSTEFMRNLPAEWVEDIPIVETTDRVRGGIDGAVNQPTIELAKRTAYLKKAVTLDPVKVIEASAEWSDVPAHSDPAFDMQAQALANRTEELNEFSERLKEGNEIIGPMQRVDWQVQDGPYIARPQYSTQDLLLFVDPQNGDDSNDGALGRPFKTITKAIQLLPQNIFHKVRIYLLDGDYGTENIKLFKYYVTPRGTAGLRFIGHVASYDGEPHPIYTDTNPDAVVIGGYEHMISGITGTEELAFTGMTFKNGWMEPYDCFVNYVDCIFDGGQNPPTGYKSRHALGGHYCVAKMLRCAFKNLAKIGNCSGGAYWVFENCTLEGLHTSSSAATPGIPFSVSLDSRVIVRSSPTLIQPGPNGKPTAAGVANELNEYSSIGYQYLRRSTPARDEFIGVSSHDGGPGLSRGAGAIWYAQNHTTNPGEAIEYFGPAATSRKIFKYNGTVEGGAKDVLTLLPRGDTKTFGTNVFSANKTNLSTLLNNGEAALYTSQTTGNVFLAVKFGDVVKYTRLLDFETATPFS